MARQALPDPQFTAQESGCLACAYPLTGLGAAGSCPECGAAYGGDVVVLHGVPGRVSAGPLWRRLVWVAITVVAVLFSQLFVVLLISPATRVVAGVLFLALAGGVIAMLATSRRERAGSERMIFTQAGIRQMPMRGHDTSPDRVEAFMEWGLANAVELRRVSPFWRRVRIGYVSAPGRRMTLIFDAGVRCPDDAAPRVEALLAQFVTGARRREGPSHAATPDHPPVAE